MKFFVQKSKLVAFGKKTRQERGILLTDNRQIS